MPSTLKQLIRRMSSRRSSRAGGRVTSRPSEQTRQSEEPPAREDPVGDTYQMNVPRDHVTVGFTLAPGTGKSVVDDQDRPANFDRTCVYCYNPFTNAENTNGETVHVLRCCGAKVGAVCFRASEAVRCPFCAKEFE